LNNSKNVSLKAVNITTVVVAVYSFVVKCHVELNVAPHNVWCNSITED